MFEFIDLFLSLLSQQDPLWESSPGTQVTCNSNPLSRLSSKMTDRDTISVRYAGKTMLQQVEIPRARNVGGWLLNVAGDVDFQFCGCDGMNWLINSPF